MSSKVLLYCTLLFCFEYVASIPFSEEPLRQTTYQPNNWQSNQNIPEQSWDHDSDVSRTQNVNSMAHSSRRHENNKEYKANSESHHESHGQSKHELLPLESLQEGPSDLQIDPNTYPTRTDNQHYRQHNSPNFKSASSASRSGVTNYRSPLIPTKQKPYHVPNREPIHNSRGNHQNFNDDTLRPVAKYSGSNRHINPVEINSRSQSSGENYDNYDVAHATAQNTRVQNHDRNTYIENTPRHSGLSYSAPSSYHGGPVVDDLKKEDYYYNNDHNRFLTHSQNNPSYNNQRRNILPNLEIDNFGNPKYLEYPLFNSRPKHTKQQHESYVNRYVDNADDNANPSSGLVGDTKSFQNVFRKSASTSNQKNTKGKKKSSHGHRFMIIHKNGTVEYLDQIDEKPRYSIIPTGDKTRNNKNIMAANDNDYRPLHPLPSSNDNYNSEDGALKSLDSYQFTSLDGTTPKALTKDSSEVIQDSSDLYSSKSNDKQYVAPSGTDNDSKRPVWEKNPSAPPSDSYRYKTSTLSPEDKEVQEYLDSISDNNDDKESAKPASNTDKSKPANQEDGLIQEFLDSLSKKPNSNQHSSTLSYGDNDSTTQAAISDSNSNSSSTTVSPVKTTVADEIITISPIELATENINNQSSDDSISTLTSKSTKTNDDSSESSKDSNIKCHHSADSDCLTNIDAPTNNDDSTTEKIDTDEQSDVKKSDTSVTMNDLKLILDIPNESSGTLKLILNLPDNTGKESSTGDEKLHINVDTKDYRESDSVANKKNVTVDHTDDRNGVDKEKNTLIDLINSITAWNKTTDKDFINLLPSDNSTVNLWYLIQMQPQCQPIVEKSKVTTIYPNGTIVEELTETTRQNKDDDEPTVVKTTKISHKDHKRH